MADAARRIEARHFRLAFPGARIVLAPNTEPAISALLAVDDDDLIVGATRGARLALGITDERLAGALPAETVLSGDKEGAESFGEAERGVLQRALLRSRGNVSAAARLLGISRATNAPQARQGGAEGPLQVMTAGRAGGPPDKAH